MFRHRLLEEYAIASPSQLDGIDEAVEEQIEDALAFARQTPAPDATTVRASLYADPINPPTSPLSFHSSSSSAPFSGQMEHEEPVAKAFTASPPTNAEGARPPRANSLLAKLHHLFSTKEEPLLSNVEKDTSPSSLSGQLHTPEPMAKGVSTPAEGALPQPANSMLARLSPLSFEQEPASPRLASQSGNARATEDVGATFTTENASTWSPLTEPPPLSSKVAELPRPLETEPSQPILSGQSDFAAAPTDAESAGARQANSFDRLLGKRMRNDS